MSDLPVTQSAMQRAAWSIGEIAEGTGLSRGFLRAEVRRGRLPIRKFGRRVLVLNDDLQKYLSQGSERAMVLQDVA
jgi:excisionase family DNA binding protein